MKNKNIVLIGMPGAGKSTTGVILAKTLNMPFLDTDLTIQQNEGRLLQEIINSDGIEKFLAIEEKALLQTEAEGHIIATGGSAVYSDAAMRHLKEKGTVVYLQLEFREIENRIKNIKSRGIAMGEGKKLIDTYHERVPLYEKYADVVIRCTGKDLEDVINELIKKIYL